MNIFIMTDIEGISGVDTGEVWDSTSEAYKEGVLRLMEDTNAAIEGAFRAGADRVLVYDGHGGGKNFIKEMLDKRAEQVTDYDMPGLFNDCKAFLMIGLHAKAGTRCAFLDHTQSSKNWYNYYINGKTYGELAQEAAYCGAYGVPVVMASGDEAACREAMEMIPGIECAVVKKAEGRMRAHSIELDKAHALITEAVVRGITKADSIAPFRPALPMELKVEYTYTHICDEVMRGTNRLERVDGRTVRRTVDKIQKFGDVLP